MQAHRFLDVSPEVGLQEPRAGDLVARINAQSLRGIARIINELTYVMQEGCGYQRGRTAVAAGVLRDLQCMLELGRIFSVAFRPEALEETKNLGDDRGCHLTLLRVPVLIGLYQFQSR